MYIQPCILQAWQHRDITIFKEFGALTSTATRYARRLRRWVEPLPVSGLVSGNDNDTSFRYPDDGIIYVEGRAREPQYGLTEYPAPPHMLFLHL